MPPCPFSVCQTKPRSANKEDVDEMSALEISLLFLGFNLCFFSLLAAFKPSLLSIGNKVERAFSKTASFASVDALGAVLGISVSISILLFFVSIFLFLTVFQNDVAAFSNWRIAPKITALPTLLVFLFSIPIFLLISIFAITVFLGYLSFLLWLISTISKSDILAVLSFIIGLVSTVIAFGSASAIIIG